MTRKIIQILDTPDTSNYQGHLTALCDDGTIWFFSAGGWDLLIQQIPQDEIN